MLCTFWYQLHNLKNVKNTHRRVSLSVKNIIPLWVFSTFFKLYKWYQIVQRIILKLVLDVRQLYIFPKPSEWIKKMILHVRFLNFSLRNLVLRFLRNLEKDHLNLKHSPITHNGLTSFHFRVGVMIETISTNYRCNILLYSSKTK